MNGLEAAVAKQREREDHERRMADLAEKGWRLTEEGLILDTSDGRWSKTSREIVEFADGLSFEEAVKSAWSRQKQMEAVESAERQRKGKSR
jgi:hypothetical protein